MLLKAYLILYYKLPCKTPNVCVYKYLSIEMESKTLILPSPSTINQIYSDLGTSETKVDLDVKFLKEWMRKQPHLPNPEDDERIVIDDKRIKKFLFMCKNSLEKTKVKLDQHYTIKLSYPEYFSKWDPTSPEIVRAMKLYCYVPLPKPTHDGHRVSFICLRTKDADNIVYDDMVKLFYMTIDLRIAKLDTYNKDVVIIDFNNNSMNHIAAFSTNIVKSIGSTFAAYPVQPHGIHLINVKSYFQPIINLAISAMKKKVSDRVIVHKSVEELKNYIDPNILPLNYGGTYPKTSDEIADDWYDEMKKHREWLIAQSLTVADNSKRPKNFNNQLDNFENAIEGSFRKLEVD